MTKAQETLNKLKAERQAAMQKAKNYDRVANEGAEGFLTAEQVSQKYFDLISAAEDVVFAEKWTLEHLTAERARWNEQVVNAKSYADIAALEKKLGLTVGDLKKAKQLHGIQ
jgi:hypothetical protein